MHAAPAHPLAVCRPASCRACSSLALTLPRSTAAPPTRRPAAPTCAAASQRPCAACQILSRTLWPALQLLLVPPLLQQQLAAAAQAAPTSAARSAPGWRSAACPPGSCSASCSSGSRPESSSRRRWRLRAATPRMQVRQCQAVFLSLCLLARTHVCIAHTLQPHDLWLCLPACPSRHPTPHLRVRPTDMQWLLYELLWRDFFRFVTKKYAVVGPAGAAAAAAAGTGAAAMA